VLGGKGQQGWIEEPGRDQLPQRRPGGLRVILMETRARSVFRANIQGQVRMDGIHNLFDWLVICF
jgi:hypothetical protein